MNHKKAEDQAECGALTSRLSQLGRCLDDYLQFAQRDPQQARECWQPFLARSLPEAGIGMDALLEEMKAFVIPYGSPIPKPGCTAFITTGATTAGALATLAGAVAAPQRIGLTAFNFLEELSLQWLVELFELPAQMKGIYSSGGSVANLVALGGARQHAFEKWQIDPARDGVTKPCRIYANRASHHTIHRAAAVLGLGRRAVIDLPEDATGQILPQALSAQIAADLENNFVPVAVVANAGTTSTGEIDPIQELGTIAREAGIWFHVDGAYGLPGMLDPQVRPLYQGLSLADSVTVDPHKWLGAPVGIGATFVRDRALLNRAFTQEHADYLEGSCTTDNIRSSLDSLGIPYGDLGVELSAPSRGAVVWALIREIGRAGLKERVCRHNAMARRVAQIAGSHPNLEVVQPPTLSICCFRFVDDAIADLNAFNRRIHRELLYRGNNLPSTAMIRGNLAIRPCFVGARTSWEHADSLVNEVVAIGQELLREDEPLRETAPQHSPGE